MAYTATRPAPGDLTIYCGRPQPFSPPAPAVYCWTTSKHLNAATGGISTVTTRIKR